MLGLLETALPVGGRKQIRAVSSHHLPPSQPPQFTLPPVDTLHNPLAIDFEVPDWSRFEPIINGIRGFFGTGLGRTSSEELSHLSEQKGCDDETPQPSWDEL